jgi:hypothetical protein
MKTSTRGIVSAAILMVVAGVGFGIAQAAGNRSYDPMLSFGDQDVPPSSDMGQAIEQGRFSDPYNVDLLVETGNLPEPSNVAGTNTIGEFMEWPAGEFVPEGNYAGTDWQAREPVETGAVPVMVPEESWMKEYGND